MNRNSSKDNFFARTLKSHQMKTLMTTMMIVFVFALIDFYVLDVFVGLFTYLALLLFLRVSRNQR